MLLTTGQGMGPQFKTPINTSIPELDITGMTYQSVTADITASGFSRGFDINSDGTKLYLVDFTNLSIVEYSFGTANDITTLTATGNTLDLSAVFTSLYDVSISDNDTQLYIVGPSLDEVRQYTMSTPSDLSTVSYSGNSLDLSVAMGGNPQPKGISVVANGTKLFATNDADEKIYGYTLSTPYDLSTASYDQVSAATARGFIMFVNEAGTKILIDEPLSQTVYQYSLSTPYDLSTMVQSATLDVSGTLASLWGMVPSSDNSKLFVCEIDGNFYEYA